MPAEITVRTNLSGAVNAETIKGSVLASIDTDRGGRSACEYKNLPSAFSPAAFGTFL